MRIMRAHVTAKAKTDVFVGHGSIMVTVLSRLNMKKNDDYIFVITMYL